MSREQIKCKACGALNDVTAFECAGCGASLVGGGDSRWADARVRDRVLDADAEAAAENAARIRRAVAVVVALGVVVAALSVLVPWYSRNYYARGEPLYDNKPAAYWVELLLKSEDHFMRRRAALAIDTICDRFNERTAREIVPSLKLALEDEDERVRNHVLSALAKIKVTTGVT